MVHYVRSLSGLSHEEERAENAEANFKTYCAVCHAQDGTGNQLVGAPNLTDEVWLYGGSSKEIEFTLKHGRSGNMPADRKSTRLNSSHVRISYAVFCLKKTTAAPRIQKDA